MIGRKKITNSTPSRAWEKRETTISLVSDSTGKINSTFLFVLALFVVAIVSGLSCGFWAYSQGTEALKSINKPDDNPTRKLAGKQQNTKSNKPYLLDESKILKDLSSMTNKADNSKKNEASKKETKTKDLSPNKNIIENKINSISPLIAQKDGVTLEVLDVIREGNSLTLEVNLRNESSQPVRFLYSFLEIRDDRDRALSAITDGLPSELPENSENFSGTIRIPTALLDEVNSLSLVLTDYPDQKIELKLDAIPVNNEN
jgi:hypothetical protein